jgi:peptidoglycan/LPS O-acetylase OafA/YrhL
MSTSPLTSLPTRSAPLDLLRTIAIALVFLSHFRIFGGQEWFQTIGAFGWAGVDLFFVLSGFLISSQLFRSLAEGRPIRWLEFYFRRGMRIWPSFLAVLALYLLVPGFTERSVLAPLWKFLTFTMNFGLDYRVTGAYSHA